MGPLFENLKLVKSAYFQDESGERMLNFLLLFGYMITKQMFFYNINNLPDNCANLWHKHSKQYAERYHNAVHHHYMK